VPHGSCCTTRRLGHLANINTDGSLLRFHLCYITQIRREIAFSQLPRELRDMIRVAAAAAQLREVHLFTLKVNAKLTRCSELFSLT
jgi:hypothetical protein